jgi:ectoine hydroxylase-related dioxygenase (phytanoyl-CoA dioxygenase family)
MDIDATAESVLRHGYAILEHHLDEAALARTHRSHVEALAAADPRDTARSASGRNTRTYLPAHQTDLDRLYLDPVLLAVAARILPAPFKLSAFLSRTVHPGASAQALHADMARDGAAPALLGFIYMLDDFRADNGATRLVPGSHRGSAESAGVLAVAPAGSLLVYDGAVLHGFTGNRSDGDRRSIQGAFVLRSTPSIVERPWRLGRNDLARYLLGGPSMS